ncbi:MAG: adenylate/guanylate cyclase domain-containing protein [Rhodococcus sp.]|nr:adenylate/guanylate cyclase domain-containing protein [Rhodococcus sp. (in: high G+C Gram-positive bacteria)]
MGAVLPAYDSGCPGGHRNSCTAHRLLTFVGARPPTPAKLERRTFSQRRSVNQDEPQPEGPAGDAGALSRIQGDLEEYLLGGTRKYDQGEVSALVGVNVERADQLWVAMGFALDDDPEAKMFTDADVQALRSIVRLVDQGTVAPGQEIAAARALGQTMSRLAEWQVSMISTHVLETLTDSQGKTPDEIRQQVTDIVTDIVPTVESLQSYVWRRHMASTTGRNVGNPGSETSSRQLVIGFADIVGYTSLTRRIQARELSELLGRFEYVSAEVITQNQGWVVKTVGDEVMFAAESVADAAEIGLRLQETVLTDDEDPQLRVGLAYGSALVRFGDLYGSVVNTAARLTGIARPGTVLVDSEFAEELAQAPTWRLRQLRPRRVRGIRRLEPYVLRRGDE